MGDQLAVDIAGEVGFRDAVAVGGNHGRNLLEPEIGDGEARGRNHKTAVKPSITFARNRTVGSLRDQARFDIPTPEPDFPANHSRNKRPPA
jgi:hypothetical protein